MIVFTPPDDLNSTAPAFVLAVPSVNADAPCTVNVPVKLPVLLIVCPFINPEVIVPLEMLMLPDCVAPNWTKPLLAIPPSLSAFEAYGTVVRCIVGDIKPAASALNLNVM